MLNSCNAHMSTHWLRGYTASLRGEPISNSSVYQGQAKYDYEAGHVAAKKEDLSY